MRVLLPALLVGALLGCAAQTPAPTSPSASSQPALLGTTWAAIEIDGRPVAAGNPQHQPTLTLAGDGARVTGSTGCNRVSGSFTHQGSSLRFGMLASTRMACVPDRGPIENAFLAALDAAASQAIVDGTLELRDAAGAVRMRLRARSSTT